MPCYWPASTRSGRACSSACSSCSPSSCNDCRPRRRKIEEAGPLAARFGIGQHWRNAMRMSRPLAGIAAAALALCAMTASAEARTIAMVFKVLNNAFTPPLQQGCAQAAKDLKVECIFIGPQEYNEAQEVQMAQDMIQRGVDGLAVSAGNPKAMAIALRAAKEKGIPVVTFDSDVLPEFHDLRYTFIGTDNYLFGAKLAELVLQTKKGGTVCIQSGAPASLNLDDRIQGIRDTLAGAAKANPVKRLTGQNGWTEPTGCPVYNNDSIQLAAQQVFDVLTAQPKLDAFIAVGGWAQYAPEA